MRIEYDKIAEHYDAHRHGGGPYIGMLAGLARKCGARDVLELGAGTGANTQAFLDAHSCRLTAVDLSAGMLAKAVRKGIAADWVRGSADRLPLADGIADFVFGVYVLHHLPDLACVFQECARVLRRGAAAFITAPTDFIERHPMNRYFPSFAKVDTARFQSVPEILDALRRAGFDEAVSERYVDAPRPIGPEYVERIAGRFISTYDLLPPDEFDAGVKRLRADVAKNGRLGVDMVWEFEMVWGCKTG